MFPPTRNVDQFLDVILVAFNLKGDGFSHTYMTNSVETSTTEQKIYHRDFNWTTQQTKAML